MVSLTSSLLFLSMISISRIFCKGQRGRAERGEYQELFIFFFFFYANSKSKGSASLIKVRADVERKAESLLFPISPVHAPLVPQKGIVPSSSTLS